MKRVLRAPDFPEDPIVHIANQRVADQTSPTPARRASGHQVLACLGTTAFAQWCGCQDWMRSRQQLPKTCWQFPDKVPLGRPCAGGIAGARTPPASTWRHAQTTGDSLPKRESTLSVLRSNAGNRCPGRLVC